MTTDQQDVVIDPIKRRVRVTAEYEVDITFPAEFFDHYKNDPANAIEQYLSDFRSGLWDVESIDDVAMYAARMAALNGSGSYDGLGDLAPDYSSTKADVRFDIVDEEFDSEIL